MKSTQNLTNIHLLNSFFINNHITNISKFSFQSINSFDNLYKEKSTLVTNYIINDKISFLNKIIYLINHKFVLYYCPIESSNQFVSTDIKTIKSLSNISNEKSRDLTIYSFFIKNYCYSFTSISDKYIKFKCIHNSWQLLSENININEISSFIDINIPSKLESIHNIKLPKKHKAELDHKLSILDSLLIFQLL